MFLLIVFISEADILIVFPLFVISIIWSVLSKFAAPTTCPFRSEVFIEITPCPPLFCSLYESTDILLPKPFSVTNITWLHCTFNDEIIFDLL